MRRPLQPRQRLRTWSRSLLFVPMATIALIAILSMLKLHGSSIGLAAQEYDPSPQTAFDMRSLRSDEWHLRTPMVIRQADHGFPRTSDVGMGVHDVGVLLDFPVKSPAVIAKPQSWAYFVLDTERAFSVEWWFTVFGPFLGVYAVMAAITRSVRISALTGVLAAAAPVMAWWTVPWLGLTVLYGGLMAAALVRGGQLQGRWRYVLFGLGGWAAACCAMELYPPWMIPVGLVFAALAVSQLTRSFASWRQLLAGVGVFGGVLVLVAAVFVREHRVALEALADSVYPGRRRVGGAGGSPVLMFDAPFDALSFSGRAQRTVGGTNQSEASSGLMLWLPVGLAGGTYTAVRRSAAARGLAATMSVALLLAAWALLPVPSWLGAIVALNSVPGNRVVVGLTIAGALSAGLFAHRWRIDPAFRPTRDRIAIAVAAFAFVSGWSAVHLDVDGRPVANALVLLLVAIFAAATALLLAGRAVAGMAVAGATMLFSTARVNPLQVGLAAVRDNPMLHQVQRIDAQAPARWASLNGDIVGFTVLAAAGVPVSTGVDLYAVPDTWHVLDPVDAAEPQWNRFANVDLSVDNSLDDVVIVAPQADLLLVTTPSCGGALQKLGIGYVTSVDPTDAPCLQQVDAPHRPGERYVYRVTS